MSLIGNKRAVGYVPTEEVLKKRSNGLIEAHERKEFGFKKGLIPWNKDKTGIFSEETLQKMSDASKGKHPLTEFKKGNIPWNKNLTIEDPRVKSWNEKCVKTQKQLYAEGEISPWNKNIKTGFLSKNPEETRERLSKAQKTTYRNGRVSYFKGRYGELHPRYKGENCKKKQKRNDPAYANWVIRTKRRDKNIC